MRKPTKRTRSTHKRELRTQAHQAQRQGQDIGAEEDGIHLQHDDKGEGDVVTNADRRQRLAGSLKAVEELAAWVENALVRYYPCVVCRKMLDTESNDCHPTADDKGVMCADCLQPGDTATAGGRHG